MSLDLRIADTQLLGHFSSYCDVAGVGIHHRLIGGTKGIQTGRLG